MNEVIVQVFGLCALFGLSVVCARSVTVVCSFVVCCCCDGFVVMGQCEHESVCCVSCFFKPLHTHTRDQNN